jgi:hypothetical protein
VTGPVESSFQNRSTCPAGQQETAGSCQPCSGNTYNPTAGGICSACSVVNSQPNADHTSCVCLSGFNPEVSATTGMLNACLMTCTVADSEPNVAGNACVCKDGYSPTKDGSGTLTACNKLAACSADAHQVLNLAGDACVCAPGYEVSGGACALCGSGSIKRLPGNNTCTTCDGSKFLEADALRTACVCKDGYIGKITCHFLRCMHGRMHWPKQSRLRNYLFNSE